MDVAPGGRAPYRRLMDVNATKLIDETCCPAPKTCGFCEGTGRCCRCGGRGSVLYRSGWLRRRRSRTCIACEGTIDCGLCRGRGTLGS
ncbi:MAG: hypothetical protein GY716_15430 [bacterium]|nr:hypothetical protein [bacterium]